MWVGSNKANPSIRTLSSSLGVEPYREPTYPAGYPQNGAQANPRTEKEGHKIEMS